MILPALNMFDLLGGKVENVLVSTDFFNTMLKNGGILSGQLFPNLLHNAPDKPLRDFLQFNSFRHSTIHTFLKVESKKIPIPQICKQFINFNSTNFNLFHTKIRENKIFHIYPKFNNSPLWMFLRLNTEQNSLFKHFHSPNNNNKYIILIFIYL